MVDRCDDEYYPGNWRKCDLDKGHDGVHVAYGINRIRGAHVIAAWPNTDSPHRKVDAPPAGAEPSGITNTPSQPSPKGCDTASHGPGSVGGATTAHRWR